MTGRTIVRVELTEWDGADEHTASELTCHECVLHLDNGARVRFHVEESEVGVYGVTPIYHPPPKRGPKTKANP